MVFVKAMKVLKEIGAYLCPVKDFTNSNFFLSMPVGFFFSSLISYEHDL